jgi:hypothetical protein
MDSELLYYIKKALEYYDTIKDKYKVSTLKNKKPEIIPQERKIILNNESYSYELLGVFDTNTDIFIWAYSIPIIDNNFKKESESLHIYGLKQNVIKQNESEYRRGEGLEDDNFLKNISLVSFYIKTVFANSRILINNNLELDIILALSSYFLKDRIKFIYDDEKDGLISYYLIK